MIRGNFRNIIQLFYKFGTQSKGKRNYINIGKIIQQQEQSKTAISTLEMNPSLKKSSLISIEQQSNQQSDIRNQWGLPSQNQGSHMSTEQQQMNHKIKSAIRCSSLYYECTKRKHKLQMRHYALMFCKILELRGKNAAERKNDEDFINFLLVIQKLLGQMPPEELVRMVHAMKYENVTKHELRLLMPIIGDIIDEFTNGPTSDLEPKSFQTLRLSTNIKLFHSLLFILEQTGSHFQKKLKLLMNQTLNYILFKSMKTKRHSKGGEYFPLGLKISFLFSCGFINASNACIKNLLLSILVQRERLTLENLLDIEAILFESPQVLEKTRKQLFTQKEIHTKYNILYRILKYMNEHFPSNLKKPNTYSLLNKKIVNHLTLLSRLTLEQLNVLEMTSTRDDHQYRILCLYHQAYKNFLIEDYSSISEKEDVVAFFHKSQNLEYSLYHLLHFFYSKLSNDGVNALRPTVKKQLKEFINLLTKFFNKLNFLTQSLIIQLLVLSNYTSLKPIATEFLQINTFVTASRKVERPHFFTRDKIIMANKFFEMINYHQVFRQHCLGQYEVFINSNIKNILKYLFKSNEQLNVQKYAFHLAQYCQTLSPQSLKSFIDQVIQSYLRLSSLNRSFKKEDVDTIYKNKEYFLSTNIDNHYTQLQNQTDIFGTNILQKEQNDIFELERLLPTIASDKEVLRQHYDLQQKIRHKLRTTFRNFKFVILLLQNIKLTSSNYQTLINQEMYLNLLQNFKSEIECLKFQRLFTKENCSDLTQIHQFLNNIWHQTLSKVQVRNQSLMHKHEHIKDNHEIKPESNHKQQHVQKQTQLQASSAQNSKLKQTRQLKKNTQQMQILDQDQQQSQQAEYTEEVEYLKGQDLLSLQTLKQYNLKLIKSSEYFHQKNKKTIQEIQLLTIDFTQLPKDIAKSQEKVDLLKKLLQSYSPINHLGNDKVLNDMRLIDLPTIDETNVQRENLKQLLNVQVQNKENRQIHSLRVFQKYYPTFVHFGLTKDKSKNQSDKSIPTVYYVNTSQMKKNKKKQTEHIELQNQPINQRKEQTQEHTIKSTYTRSDEQKPNQQN